MLEVHNKQKQHKTKKQSIPFLKSIPYYCPQLYLQLPYMTNPRPTRKCSLLVCI